LKLAFELASVYAVFEGLSSIDQYDRDLVAVALTQLRIEININLFKRELVTASGGMNRRFGLLAQMTPRPRVQNDRSAFLHRASL